MKLPKKSALGGSTAFRIPIYIIDDSVQQEDKTIVITLSDGTDYDLDEKTKYTLTITERVIPEVSFAPVNVDTRTAGITDTVDEDVGVHNMKLYLSPAPTSDITVKYNISTGYAWGSATGGVGAQAHRQPADGRMGLDGLPIDGGREGLSLTTTADALLVETTSKETTGLDAGNATISLLPIALAVGIRQDRGGDAETGCG
ncbi:MAG: hypothetical protein OXF67_04995, partial [Cyanobacteria bacterium MAG CAR4_bin_6]|nr:hypothetical protein [Cyanobacteria bacterium MAG CAR4_bin_6]